MRGCGCARGARSLQASGEGEGKGDGASPADGSRVSIKPANLKLLLLLLPPTAAEAPPPECGDGAATDAAAYTAVYEYEEGDCVFIDNLAVAHRATPEAHEAAADRGLRILHRSTIKAPKDFTPPHGLPPALNIAGPNPLGPAAGGVWAAGGLGFRWDETIPMQN